MGTESVVLVERVDEPAEVAVHVAPQESPRVSIKSRAILDDDVGYGSLSSYASDRLCLPQPATAPQDHASIPQGPEPFVQRLGLGYEARHRPPVLGHDDRRPLLDFAEALDESCLELTNPDRAFSHAGQLTQVRVDPGEIKSCHRHDRMPGYGGGCGR